jgi:hypothetical protein
MHGFITRAPGYHSLRRAWQKRFNPLATNRFLQFAPPGHFNSPIPDFEFVQRHRARLFDRDAERVPGIENYTSEQLALLEAFVPYYDEMPFQRGKQPGLRYYFDNPYFTWADALVLYSMLRRHRPRRVIEVGSGFSSAVMLDTNDLFLSRSIRFTFIEPFPDRLLSLIGERDRRECDVLPVPVQEVPLTAFESLEAGDVLFVDSSHTAKIGSDVVYLLTDVLPHLRAGVLIHVHDIFWPFEYPEEWVREGRAWNENYVLKAFLQFNSSFRILLFTSYLTLHHRPTLERLFPLWMTAPGASLWLTKVF